MNCVRELHERVADESIRLIQIIGVPRSASTALGRALNEGESESIYVNEPLNRRQDQLVNLATIAIQKSRQLEGSSKGPLTVITKSMASYIPSGVYDELLELAYTTIWTVRDPLVQMGSLATRLANDLAVQRGADFLQQEDIGPYLNDISSMLQESERSIGFSKTGWASIRQLFHKHPSLDRSIVVNAGEFTNNAAQTLSSICEQAGLRFSESMVSGWQKDFTNLSNGDNKATTASSAWTKDVTNSHAVIPLDRVPLAIELLPRPMQDHILNVAQPTYDEMVASSMDMKTLSLVGVVSLR